MAISGGMPNFLGAPLVDNGMGDLIGKALESYKLSMQARQAPRQFETEQTGRELANTLAGHNIEGKQLENKWYEPKTMADIEHTRSGTGLNNANIGLVAQNTQGASLDNKKKMMAQQLIQEMQDAGKKGQDVTKFLSDPNNQAAYQHLIGDLPKHVLDVMKENQTVRSDLYSQIQSSNNVVTNLNQIQEILKDPNAKDAIGPLKRDLWTLGEAGEIRGQLKPLIANLVADMGKAIGGSRLTNKELALAEAAKPNLKMPYDQFVSSLNMNKTITELAKYRAELQLKYMTEEHMPAAEAMLRAQQETGELSNFISPETISQVQSAQQNNNESVQPSNQNAQKYKKTVSQMPLEWFEEIDPEGEYLKHLSKENKRILLDTWKQKINESKSRAK